MSVIRNITDINPWFPPFRLFFLAACLYAIIAMVVWMLAFSAVMPGYSAGINTTWHVHELLYGVICAIIAGYLLTTNFRAASGKITILSLALAWLAGRIVMLLSDMPVMAVFAVDMLFPVMFAFIACAQIPATRNKKDYVIVLIVIALPVVNVIYHLSESAIMSLASLNMLNHGIILLITLVSGQLIPSLTLSRLRVLKSPVLPVKTRWVEGGVIAGTMSTAIADLLLPGTSALACLAILTALCHLYRLVLWRGYRVGLDIPLLAIHLAYAWIIVGYTLLSLSSLLPSVHHSTAMHAFNTGTLGTIVLVVMARLSVRIRNRTVTRLIYGAFAAITLSVLLRLMAYVPGMAQAVILLSGTLWCLAFTFFLSGYVISVYQITVFKRDRPDPHESAD